MPNQDGIIGIPEKDWQKQIQPLPIPASVEAGGYQTPWRPGAGAGDVDWSHATSFPGAGANVQQNWKRMGGAGGWGGHVIWNPYWGFQDFSAMAKLYSEAGGPVTREQMMGWDLTQQPGPDWAQYYPGRQAGGPNAGGGGGTPATGGGGWTTPAYPPGSTEFPYTDDLSKFGYSGPMGFNPWEQAAMEFTKDLYADQGPLQTLGPARDFYTKLLSEEFGPESEKYIQGVYDPIKEEMESILGEQSKRIGSQFAHRGGFFGGKHGMAQSRLAREGSRDLTSILANLKQGAFQSNVTNMMGGATGMTGLAGTEMGISSNILRDILGVGGMATERDMTNRALWQDAMLRQYQDWQRARQENLLPMNWLLGGAGMQTQMPFAQQPQPSPWSYLLQGVGQGAATLPFLL